MPNTRCKHYDNEGNPVNEGCFQQGRGCEFVHPSEPGWDQAKRFVARGRGGHVGGFGRGAPSGRGSGRADMPLPTGPRRGTTNAFAFGFSLRGRGGATSGNSSSKTGGVWDFSSAWSSEDQPIASSGWSKSDTWGSANNDGDAGGWVELGGSDWNVETTSKNESKAADKEQETGKEVVDSAWGSSTGNGGGANTSSADSWGGGVSSWNIENDGTWGDSSSGWPTGGGDSASTWGSNEKKDAAPEGDAPTKPAAKDLVSNPLSNTASMQDISGWGTSASFTGTSLPSTSNDSSGLTSTAAIRDDKRKSTYSSMPPPPVPQRRPSVDIKLSDRAQVRPPTQNMLLSTPVESTPMDVDSTVSTSRRCSTPLISPTTARDTYFTPSVAPFPPRINAIASSSRAGSVVPSDSGSSSVPKSFKDISRAQAKREWDKHLRLMARAQRLCKEAENAERDLKQYKAIQRSPQYSKVCKSATEILDLECVRLTQDAAMSRQNYDRALSALVSHEDAFDFPIQALVTKTADVEKVSQDLTIIKGYVHDVKTWMDPVQGVLEELDARSKKMLEPQIPPTTIPTTTATMSVEIPQEQSVQSRESEQRISNTLKHLKARKIVDRVEQVEDNISQLQQTVDELLSGNQLWDLVQSKLADFAYNEEREDSDEEGEDLSVMMQVSACKAEVATFDEDIGTLGKEVAILMTKVAELEIGVEESERASSLERTKVELASMKKEYEAMRKQNDHTAELLNQTESQLVELRALAATIQSASANPPVQLPSVELIVNAILPLVQEQVGTDCTSAMEKMEKEVFNFIQEEESTTIRNIWKEMQPSLNGVQTAYERLERKGIHRPRPVSPHTAADSRLGASSHPNHT